MEGWLVVATAAQRIKSKHLVIHAMCKYIGGSRGGRKKSKSMPSTRHTIMVAELLSGQAIGKQTRDCLDEHY